MDNVKIGTLKDPFNGIFAFVFREIVIIGHVSSTKGPRWMHMESGKTTQLVGRL